MKKDEKQVIIKKGEDVLVIKKDEELVVSDKGEMKTPDWKSLAITSGIVALSAVIPYLLELLPQIELESETAQLLMGIFIMVLKFGQKYFSDREYIVKK